MLDEIGDFQEPYLTVLGAVIPTSLAFYQLEKG